MAGWRGQAAAQGRNPAQGRDARQGPVGGCSEERAGSECGHLLSLGFRQHGKRAVELGRACFLALFRTACSSSTVQLPVLPLTQPFRSPAWSLTPRSCSPSSVLPQLGPPPHPSPTVAEASAEAFTPDPPSRHIRGQMGLLETSILPAMVANTVPSELASASLSDSRPPVTPSFCCLRAGPREGSGLVGRAAPQHCRFRPDSARHFQPLTGCGRGFRLSGLLHVTTVLGKGQRDSSSGPVAQVLHSPDTDLGSRSSRRGSTGPFLFPEAPGQEDTGRLHPGSPLAGSDSAGPSPHLYKRRQYSTCPLHAPAAGQLDTPMSAALPAPWP